MFGMSMPELILILAVALIVIGPKKLPDLAKSLGRALGEFKKATNDFKDSISMDSTLNEVKDEFKDLGKKVKDPLAAPSTADKKESETDTEPGTTTASGTNGSHDDTAETRKTDEGQAAPDQDPSDATTSPDSETDATDRKTATSPHEPAPSPAGATAPDADTEGPLKHA
jgi:TatA/E family protein of Tat protein translocase